MQKVAAKGGRTHDLANLFTGLGVTIVPFVVTTAELAADLYPKTRHVGLSLGDRACLALAIESGRKVYTADKDWTGLDLDVSVQVIR